MTDPEQRLRDADIPEPAFHLRRIRAAGVPIEPTVDAVISGTPLHRAIGSREFHGLNLALSSATLEPRDDTEALVTLALAHLPANARVADLGTGTGAVGLALLSERSAVTAVLTDISEQALETARRNAVAHGLDARATIALGSWCEPLDGLFDAIVSNPPYIASATVDALDPSVRDHDPRAALDGGTDGLDAYRTILETAAAHLAPDGFLALEIGFDQAQTVPALAKRHGWRLEAAERDLGGHVRALMLVRENS